MDFLKILGAGMSLPQVLEILLRIVVAAVCGGIVGIERSRRFKDAGVRTHSMVACAAAIMMIISKYGFTDIADLAAAGLRSADPARIAAQVVTGVSFLGAGIIYRDKQRHSLKGLTTAAGIWCVAGIGMAMGSGLYFLAVFSTIFIVILQFIMHRFQVGKDKYSDANLEIVIKDDPQAAEKLEAILLKWNMLVEDATISRQDGKLVYTMNIDTPSKTLQQEINSSIISEPLIYSVKLREII